MASNLITNNLKNKYRSDSWIDSFCQSIPLLITIFVILPLAFSMYKHRSECIVLCENTKTRCMLEKHVTDNYVTLDSGEKIKTGDETHWIIYEVDNSTMKYHTKEYNKGFPDGSGMVDCYTYKSRKNENNFKPLRSCGSRCDFLPK